MLAQFNEPDNEYIIPLYEKEGDYTGNGNEWAILQDNVWRYSGTGHEFNVGEYIQLDRYCCRIIGRTNSDYTLYPHPPVTQFATATNQQFYVHGKRVNLFDNDWTIYTKRRVGEFTFEWQEMS